MFGSPVRFDLGTGKLDSHDMTVARRKYRVFAKEFLISPAKLDDITDFPENQNQQNVPAGFGGEALLNQ